MQVEVRHLRALVTEELDFTRAPSASIERHGVTFVGPPLPALLEPRQAS